MNFTIKNKNVTIFAATFFVALFISYFSMLHLDYETALTGWGPLDYVGHKLTPENFVKDFDSGLVAGYDNSLIMQSFVLASKLGLSFNRFLPIFMFLQSYLFCLAVVFLTHSIFKKHMVTLLALMIVPFCDSAGLNLARFGLGFGGSLQLPLYYGFSYAFMLFTFAFFLREQFVWCLICMVVVTYCHVTLAFFTVAFVFSYYLIRPKILMNRRFLIGFFVFILCVIPHFFHILTNLPVSAEKVPDDIWLRLTRLFGCHWYPITMKLFSDYAYRLFFPFCLISFFGFISIRYLPKEDDKRVKIVVGCLFCLILSGAGVVFSDIYPIPFLIKFALHRASGIVSFFSILCAINYLVVKLYARNYFVTIIAVYSLFLFILVSPGVAVFPVLLFVLHDVYQGNIAGYYLRGNFGKFIGMSIIILNFSLVGIVFINMVGFISLPLKDISFVGFQKNWWGPLNFFFVWGKVKTGDMAQLMQLFVIVSIVVFLLKLKMITSWRKPIEKAFIIFSLCWMIFSLLHNKQVRWEYREEPRAKAYYDVQVWAKESTKNNALFMIDPSNCYGWRDFSRRSSFGCYREWGYTVIAYLSSNSRYEIGKKRLHYFGVDLDNITNKDISALKYMRCGGRVSEIVRKNFYSMSSDELAHIARVEHIDYIVFDKKYLRYSLELPVAYENDFYLVALVGEFKL